MCINACWYTLTDRAFKINNTWLGFDLDIKTLLSFLSKNMFPIKRIENIKRKYLNNEITNKGVTEQDKRIKMSYFILQCICVYSVMVKENLNKLIRRYCQVGVDLKLVSSVCKFEYYFRFLRLSTILSHGQVQPKCDNS